MLNKQKFTLFNKITLSVFGFFVVLILMTTVFSAFQSDAEGTVSNKIAFYVIDPVPQTQQIKIGELAPDGANFSYSIQVSNFKNGKTSEVDMDYTLRIKTTTNVSVSYKLYANGGDTDVIGTREIIQDDDGMYFYSYNPQVGSFVHGVQKTDTYTLVINFPTTYRSAVFQDLIDVIEVTVDAEQT